MRGRVLYVVIAVLILVGCGSSKSNTSSSTQSASSTTSGGSSGQGSSGSKKPVVDLTLTGKGNITLKGSNGQCMIGMKGGTRTPIAFGFYAKESDYPGLGDIGLSIDEDSGTHKVTLKWVKPDQNIGVGEVLSGGYTVSADHLSITLDANTFDISDPEHIVGSVTCPAP